MNIKSYYKRLHCIENELMIPSLHNKIILDKMKEVFILFHTLCTL